MLFYEKNLRINKVKGLGFGKCKIIIAVPEKSDIKTLKDLEGERIATSYSTILKNFLKNNNINSSIIPIGGSCEIAPNINLADAICDITQTGNTLKENNLKLLCEVMNSEAVLIESPIKKKIVKIIF
jgi:ATP phosphoribosyltransferase